MRERDEMLDYEFQQRKTVNKFEDINWKDPFPKMKDSIPSKGEET